MIAICTTVVLLHVPDKIYVPYILRSLFTSKPHTKKPCNKLNYNNIELLYTLWLPETVREVHEQLYMYFNQVIFVFVFVPGSFVLYKFDYMSLLCPNENTFIISTLYFWHHFHQSVTTNDITFWLSNWNFLFTDIHCLEFCDPLSRKQTL